jgi:hypothetical protein
MAVSNGHTRRLELPCDGDSECDGSSVNGGFLLQSPRSPRHPARKWKLLWIYSGNWV